MKIRTAVAATAGAAVLAGTGLVVTTAWAGPASASSPAGPGGSAAGKHRLLDAQQRAELRRTGHVTVVRHTRKHGDVTILVQRGEVMAVSAGSITLRSKGRYSHTYMITSTTKVVEKRVPISAADLHPGERVMVVAVQTPTGDVARRISCIREAKAAQAPAAPTPTAPTPTAPTPTA